jgi:hypothetical protein
MNARVALAKAKASQAHSAMRRRIKANNMEAMVIRQGAGIATAITLGVLNRNDVAPGLGAGADDKDGKFPWKPLLGTVALVGAALTKGSVSAGFEGMAIAANAIYTERAVSTGSLVAGSV